MRKFFVVALLALPLLAAGGGKGPAEAALNGKRLALGPDDTLPALHGIAFEAGELRLAPASINFLSFEGVRSSACS